MSFNKRTRSASASSSRDRPAHKKARTSEPITNTSDSGYPTASGWHTLNNHTSGSSPHADSPEPVQVHTVNTAPAETATAAPITPEESRATNTPAETLATATPAEIAANGTPAKAPADEIRADDTPAETTAGATPAAEASTNGRKPIAECFTAWTPPANLITLPPVQATWGIKPYPTSPAGPQPHPTSPTARTSNAATNPPLWEDRKFPFISGRYHKSFGPGPAPTDPSAPDLDQEDNLVLRLIDMRPIRSGPSKGAPRRQPITWHFQRGKPKDWTDIKQTIHALNTRRRDNLRAITLDPPWTAYERQYLAELLREFPNASITELAERHNYLFTNNFREGPLEDTMDCALHQASAELSTGRTTESFRHEYLTWKHVYDAGDVPHPARDEVHKKISNDVQSHLNGFERDWDAAVDAGTRGYPAAYVPVQTRRPKKKAGLGQKGRSTREQKAAPKASKVTKAAPKRRPGRLSFSSVSSLSDAPSELGGTPSPHYRFVSTPRGSPHGLPDELAEELLELAGYYNPGEVRSSPPYVIPSRSPSVSEAPSPRENV